MGLESMNKNYIMFKNNLETLKKEISNLSKSAKQLSTQKEKYEASKKIAQIDKDPIAEKIADDEIKRINEELKKVIEEAQNKKSFMKYYQQRIDMQIAAIKENPEMAKHLDDVMTAKYSRKIRDLSKEKEENLKKQEKIIDVQQLISNHPSLENNLRGIMSSKQEMDSLDKELKRLEIKDPSTGAVTYSDPVRANEIKNTLIPALSGKLDKNKTTLMDYIKKNKLEISEEFIDEITTGKTIKDKTGKIDVNATLNKRRKEAENKEKGLDKQISDYTTALAYIEPVQTQTRRENTNTTEAKPKWYQFVTRFKNWRENRKVKALPEPKESVPFRKSDENKFKNSLKYDIVKDIVSDIEKEDLKNAKAERKDEEVR